MKTLPKPKSCGQNWLNMKPTEVGRLCGQCHKNIVDFTKMNWSDIERNQRENNNSVCGMYSDRQLKYWGQEVPQKTAVKTLATTTLLVGLATSNAMGQTQFQNDTIKERTIIKGTITGKTKEGRIDTLGFTNVVLKNAKIGVSADEFGNYQLDITNYIDTIADPTLVFSMIGFDRFELKLDKIPKGEFIYDPLLSQDNIEITYFYVSNPTLGQRIKWKFKKWFGRKEK